MISQFGQNACGELGLGDARDRLAPTLCDSCHGKDVVHVAAGNEITAVVTNAGEVRLRDGLKLVLCALGLVLRTMRYYPPMSIIVSRSVVDKRLR